MTIDSIHVVNFRNYPSLKMDFHPKVNLIIGKNAIGKTNLCEAIYMAHYGKSFRTNYDREVIKFGKEEAYIGAQINTADFYRFMEIKISHHQKKMIRINEEPVTNQQELRKQNPIILFTPDELNLIKGSPSKRRWFLDHFLVSLSPIYSEYLYRYQKVMVQRNNHLKRAMKITPSLLDVYDEQLIQYGLMILKQRNEIIRALVPLVEKVHGELTNHHEILDLRYETFLDLEKDNLKDIYQEKMRRSREVDLRYRTTTTGPHRDDFTILINKRDARVYGSQGQQRSTVLSLKMAQVIYMEDHVHILPLLILDDVFSELDRERKSQFLKSLHKTQSFITMTDAMDDNDLFSDDYRVYRIGEKNIISNEG